MEVVHQVDGSPRDGDMKPISLLSREADTNEECGVIVRTLGDRAILAIYRSEDGDIEVTLPDDLRIALREAISD